MAPAFQGSKMTQAGDIGESLMEEAVSILEVLEDMW